MAVTLRLMPWVARLIADGGHLACAAPGDAAQALKQAEALFNDLGIKK